MSIAGSIDNLMEASGAQIHTAFTAKILSVSGDTAKIQPLFLYAGAKQAPISGVPIPQSVSKAKPVEPGDIVYCVCAEQTLGGSWKGQYTERVGRLHHQLSDAVIIAVF